MKADQVRSNYTTESLNSVQISPSLFYDAFDELIGKFGYPFHPEGKEIPLLSAIFFTEGWAKHRFQKESTASIMAAVVYSRYTAYMDVVRDMLYGPLEPELASGRFNWHDSAFISAAATVPIDSLEFNEDTYSAFFNIRAFADAVKSYADFYQHVSQLGPSGLTLVGGAA